MMVSISTFRKAHSSLGINIGLCCVVLSSACVAPNASAQVARGRVESAVKTPSNSASNMQLAASGSTRIASRRGLIIEPQLQSRSTSDDIASPSDAQTRRIDESTTTSVEANEAGKQQEVGNDINVKASAPVQSRELRLTINPVNTTTGDVGTGAIPTNIAAEMAPPLSGLPDGLSRGILPQRVDWQPADICHFPPYFEDAMLERHGHVRWGCAQPVVSGVKFFSTLPMLPYLTTMHAPCEPRYNLGHFRPGTCAPVLKDHLPWDQRAATVQLLSTAGFWVAAPL